MNTPIKPNAQDTRPPVDEQRRRLTKGGLVAPVVIGTLLSRPVLGAAPYHCTISGQLSGNVSSHGRADDQNCALLGATPTTWITKTSTLINKGVVFTAAGFTDTYWYKSSAERLVDPNTNNAQVATLQQVLEKQAQNSNEPTNLVLGRAAVASYLNALEYAPNYPLSTAQVVEMFNAVIGGGSYDPLGVNWNDAKVLTYFQSLYQIS